MSRHFFFTFICVLFVSTATLNGCKKGDDPVTKQPPVANFQNDRVRMEGGRSGTIVSFMYTQHDIDSLAEMKDIGKTSDPVGAQEFWMTFPPKIQVPPHSVPLEKISLLGKTDSTAQLTGHSLHAPFNVIVSLAKRMHGNQTIWVVTRSEDIRDDDLKK
jgi:hypothetical protein